MPSSGAPSGSAAFRTNSTATIPKATYVPLQISDNERSIAASSGGAVRKFGFIRSLNLQPGEVDASRAELTRNAGGNQASSPLLGLAKSFEGSPLPSALPARSQFSKLPDTDFIAFGNALATVRQHAVDAARANAGQPVDRSASVPAGNQVPTAVNQLNIVNIASNAYKNATSPIGMLNLERIEMTPAGIEQGGLIATIPLAPKERTMVVQQEWSVITQDFTTIVTDSLENYSETGVTDTTQLSQATDSQVAHNNQFNVNASASGSCGFVTASVATSFGSQDQNSQSAKDSRQHSVQTTKKASSRSIQSHKTTISTSTTSGSSNATTRMLENPSATEAMRIDYFSMMRKWYCALYRYGLRLTYDITVPEPGAAMREIYATLDGLQKQAGGQFTFDVKHSNISTDVNSGVNYYLALADKYSVDRLLRHHLKHL
jgi:hypothetical protein